MARPIVEKEEKDEEVSAQFVAFSELSTWEDSCRYDMESDEECTDQEQKKRQLLIHRPPK